MVTLVIPDFIAADLHRAALLPLETACVLLARPVTDGYGNLRLLTRDVRWVQDSAYLRRESDSLAIASDGYVPALSDAERDGAVAIWVHTHPGHESWPCPSDHDRIVDGQLADLFQYRSGSDYYGALIMSPRGDGFAFTGHVEFRGSQSMSIDRVWTVGSRFRLYHSFNSRKGGLSPAFDRNVRAFGPAVQQTLSDLRVAIVGCGGTGSAVAEQLVRLGVRHFILIDPDTISLSNTTRVYGSCERDVDRPKVDVLQSHLCSIAADTNVEAIRGTVTVRPVAERLAESDIVFGCTDDNAGRMVLSRVATYMITPVIDCGVLLTSREDGTLIGIDGRVTVLAPGQACLICRGRIDLGRAAAELLTPEERIRREDEGYAPALGRVEPAVVAFTSSIAAIAVAELLERFVGYGPEPRPSEVLVRYHEREFSTNSASPGANHYCDLPTRKLGLGRTEPFLEQTWAS